MPSTPSQGSSSLNECEQEFLRRKAQIERRLARYPEPSVPDEYDQEMRRRKDQHPNPAPKYSQTGPYDPWEQAMIFGDSLDRVNPN